MPTSCAQPADGNSQTRFGSLPWCLRDSVISQCTCAALLGPGQPLKLRPPPSLATSALSQLKLDKVLEHADMERHCLPLPVSVRCSVSVCTAANKHQKLCRDAGGSAQGDGGPHHSGRAGPGGGGHVLRWCSTGHNRIAFAGFRLARSTVHLILSPSELRHAGHRV